MSQVVYLPPPSAVRLPAELRRAVRAAAGRCPRRAAVLERAAHRTLVEWGLHEALLRVAWWGR